MLIIIFHIEYIKDVVFLAEIVLPLKISSDEITEFKLN